MTPSGCPLMDRLALLVVDLVQLVQEMTGRGARVGFVNGRLIFDPRAEGSCAVFQLHLLGFRREEAHRRCVWSEDVLRRKQQVGQGPAC